MHTGGTRTHMFVITCVATGFVRREYILSGQETAPKDVGSAIVELEVGEPPHCIVWLRALKLLRLYNMLWVDISMVGVP